MEFDIHLWFMFGLLIAVLLGFVILMRAFAEGKFKRPKEEKRFHIDKVLNDKLQMKIDYLNDQMDRRDL